jgi:hypothetical protein
MRNKSIALEKALKAVQAYCPQHPAPGATWGGEVDVGTPADHHLAGHESSRRAGDYVHLEHGRPHRRPHQEAQPETSREIPHLCLIINVKFGRFLW